MTVVNTIYNQLGGKRFVAMTGAKNFLSDGDKLIFNIGRNASKTNRIEIELRFDDTYTMTFEKYTPYSFKIKNGTFKETQPKLEVVKKFDGVYCDMLQELFTEVTGLYTHL